MFTVQEVYSHNMDNWVNFILNGNSENIMDNSGNRLKFLDATEDDVETSFNSVDINGIDGVLPGQLTFSPFKLVLRFSYKAVDMDDYLLFKTKMRGVLFKRTPFYINHSKMPGKKYAVVSESNTIEDLTSTFGTFEVSYLVYKGYSESVNTTDEEFLFDSSWQFENGLPLDFNPTYHHSTNQFTIWNGSSDTIDPRMKHELKIQLNLDSVEGFEIVNYTTGDIFKYYKSISRDSNFVLDGVYAYKNSNRVGIDTNRGILTLAPGRNEIRIKGNVSNIKVVFKFPFIYR